MDVVNKYIDIIMDNDACFRFMFSVASSFFDAGFSLDPKVLRSEARSKILLLQIFKHSISSNKVLY